MKHHARDIEQGPDFSSDEYDLSEEGYGEPLQARDAPAEDGDEAADSEFISEEFLGKLYARDAIDEGEEHTEEEAEAAYHEYLQTRGLDISHLTGPGPEGEDDDLERVNDLSARDVEDYGDGSEEEGSNLAARDARNAFFAGEGAHPTVNDARANSEAHRKLLAAKGTKLSARDVEGEEADENVAEPAQPEESEDSEIE